MRITYSQERDSMSHRLTSRWNDAAPFPHFLKMRNIPNTLVPVITWLRKQLTKISTSEKSWKGSKNIPKYCNVFQKNQRQKFLSPWNANLCFGKSILQAINRMIWSASKKNLVNSKAFHSYNLLTQAKTVQATWKWLCCVLNLINIKNRLAKTTSTSSIC